MASGDHLPHPDADAERARAIAARAAAEAEAAAAGDEDEEGEAEAEPPTTVKVEISDGEGNVVRTFNADVHQGINRISWGTGIDGNEPLEPVPGDDLPEGTNLPPGTYTVTLTMGEESVSGEATLTPDPRTNYTQADHQNQFDTMTHLNALGAAQNDAIRSILSTREAIGTIKGIVTAAMEDDEPADESADEPEEGEEAEETPSQAVLTRAAELEERLNEMEELFRNRPGESQGDAQG